jgi:SRSO17 transposase
MVQDLGGFGPAGWERELDGWLAPFVDALGDRRRHPWAPLYVRGLLGPGDRKSIQPVAARVAPGDYAQLHHFVAASPWDPAPLERVLAAAAQRLVGGPEAVLIIDDTTLLKQGTHSVGVTRQYAGQLAAIANCQVLVSLTLARDEVPVGLALRLFLPTAWAADRARCRRARVPAARLAPDAPRTKPALALAELDRVRAAGVTFGVVVSDAAYGQVAEFRHGLTARGLTWAVGVQRAQLVYPPDVRVTVPTTVHGRPRKHPVPSAPAVPAATLLAAGRWRTVSWRDGSRGRLHARFAAVRVRVADGPEVAHHRRLPGEPAWLLGEERAGGERHYYLTNHPAATPLRTLVRAVKARWSCEQAHQQLKEELGLDHFEGRTWPGLHHHALLTLISFAFLQHLRLREVRAAGGGGKTRGGARRPAAPTQPPGGPPRRPHPPNGGAAPGALPAMPPPFRLPSAPLTTSV